MEDHPLNVLLLGWDEAVPAARPAATPTLVLSRHLAEYTPVSVIVPHLPETATLTSADQVIRLNLLSAAQLAAAATTRRAASPGSWQAPAAPYTGASPPSFAGSSAPEPFVRATAPAVPTTTDATLAAPAAGPGLDLLNRDAFAEATAEVGPDEAADTYQAEDDLTLAAPADSGASPPPSGRPVAASPATQQAAAQASFVQALRSLNATEEGGDLNFRVIQYARFATPLAVSQPFGVIYAPAWPSWLAALEIRQTSGRPLVLHVQSLAADRDSPADRGWILELERLTLRRADLILANTDALAQRLTSFYALPAARIRVIDAADTAAINDALTHVTPRS